MRATKMVRLSLGGTYMTFSGRSIFDIDRRNLRLVRSPRLSRCDRFGTVLVAQMITLANFWRPLRRPFAWRLRLAILFAIAIAITSCSTKNEPPEHTYQMIVPPLTSGSYRTNDMSVPIGLWQAGTENIYRTYEDCTKARDDMVSTWRAQARQIKRGENQQILDEAARYSSGICLATDDPRLH